MLKIGCIIGEDEVEEAALVLDPPVCQILKHYTTIQKRESLFATLTICPKGCRCRRHCHSRWSGRVGFVFVRRRLERGKEWSTPTSIFQVISSDVGRCKNLLLLLLLVVQTKTISSKNRGMRVDRDALNKASTLWQLEVLFVWHRSSSFRWRPKRKKMTRFLCHVQAPVLDDPYTVFNNYQRSLIKERKILKLRIGK